MKFLVELIVLRQAVMHAAEVVDVKHHGVLMTTLMLDVADGRLRLLGTDSALGAIVQVDVTMVVPGKTCVSAKKLVDIVKSAPDGTMLLSLEQGELHVLAKYQEIDGKPSCKSRWSIRAYDHAGYPTFPKFKDEQAIHVEVLPFVRAATRVLTGVPEAKSNDPKYMGMIGLWFNEGLLYSCDHHATIRENACTALTVKDLLIPKEAVVLLLGLLKKTSAEMIQMDRHESFLLFRIGSEVYHAALRDVKFPDVEKIMFLPSDRFARVTLVPRTEFLEALDRAEVTTGDSYWLALRYENGGLVVRSRDDLAGSFVERIDGASVAEGPDEPWERNLHLRHFRDLLSICRNPKVALRLGDGTTVQEQRVRIEDDGLVAVLMPIAVQKKVTTGGAT